MPYEHTVEYLSAKVRVRIVSDDDPIDPCVDYDQFGKMVCFHSRYNLGHETPKCDSLDYLIGLASDVLPDGVESLARKYRKSGESWDDASYMRDYELRCRIESDPEKLHKVIEAHYLMLPLYLYDHSGLTMRTTSFSCSWDSGQVGFIFASKADAIKEFSKNGRLTAKARQAALDCMTAEVESYDDYLTGNCWGFIVEVFDGDEWEQFDSRWGFLGDPDYCLEEGKAAAQYEARRIADADASEFAAMTIAQRPDMYANG